MPNTTIDFTTFTPWDLLPQENIQEKLASLVVGGIPEGLGGKVKNVLEEFRQRLDTVPKEEVRLVVFGGGTGLSNIIGGDSRQQHWGERPFHGLKELFPQTKAIVCTTDNGGSTGEMLKDLDMIALGDIRHVLLSSIQSQRLCSRYHLSISAAQEIALQLAAIFNYRFFASLREDDPRWQELERKINSLPQELSTFLQRLIRHLYASSRLCKLFQRSHCLGNLLVAAAIDEWTEENQERGQRCYHRAILQGLSSLAASMGCGERAVMPVTSTPAQLVVRYVNGVEIPGEHKLATANRGVAIEGTTIGYSGKVQIYDEVLADIAAADIILFAPGSLFSSILPVLQVPGIAHAIRENSVALKMLVANLWVQKGETDISVKNPDRRFYVSDMLTAYEKNIPDGTKDLFQEVLCVSLRDIPASILQRYDVEGKMPIFLDRKRLIEKGYTPVECDIFSETLLQESGVIQHDAVRLARVVRGLYLGRNYFLTQTKDFISKRKSEKTEVLPIQKFTQSTLVMLPSIRYTKISRCIANMSVENADYYPSTKFFKDVIAEIIWDNPVIALSHLSCFHKIELVSNENWGRKQQWDNVFSYFDPIDSTIKMRVEELTSRRKIELALCVGLGESLLGDYAERKEIVNLEIQGTTPGRIYHLYLRDKNKRHCFFNNDELLHCMNIAKMYSADSTGNHFTRLLNKEDVFTPPGLFMGLTYAWYVDNRLSSYIDYRMSLLGLGHSNIVPNEIYMAKRCKQVVDFFREVVFAPYWVGNEGES